jgi:hypothetical protein
VILEQGNPMEKISEIAVRPDGELKFNVAGCLPSFPHKRVEVNGSQVFDN